MKLIFGGFEEYMSTLHIPNMKIKLPIEMTLYGFYYFWIIIGLSYNSLSLLSPSPFSLKIGADIIKMEKYFVLEFSIMYPHPQDP